ncbi:sensor histidine kinase [Micromonospora sp. U56]|uniref:sensor histidine kinase n=1 Tax=Micromonospora sp. U56 TaxID=2824900 RepID=UPI001FFD6F1B|nr:sensor histidine kinase [Micromonospora sp. U56]
MRLREHSGSRRHEAAADLALAVVLLLLGLLATGPAGRNQPGATPVDAGCLALVTVATLALTGRRLAPRATLAVVAVAVSAYLVLGYPYGPVLLTFLVAVYTVAVRLPIRPAAVAGAAALAVILVHVFWSRGASPGLPGVLPGSAWVVVPFALGVAVRTNRETVTRARTEQARRQADEERLRIAQEVHDVVGHGLAAISMQADIALHLMPKRPEQAEAALTAISRTSREALDELRVTLGAVRRGTERGPVPGLARLDALRERLAGAGLAVDLRVTGEPRPLPGAVDLAAYRVVQEALTNVLRHARVDAARVRVDYGREELVVEVTDRGVGGPGAAGHGLAGMRERVTALGGSLTAGPGPDGGFRVSARLPVEARR